MGAALNRKMTSWLSMSRPYNVFFSSPLLPTSAQLLPSSAYSPLRSIFRLNAASVLLLMCSALSPLTWGVSVPGTYLRLATRDPRASDVSSMIVLRSCGIAGLRAVRYRRPRSAQRRWVGLQPGMLQYTSYQFPAGPPHRQSREVPGR